VLIVVPLQVGRLELLEWDPTELRLEMPLDHALVRLVSPERPGGRLDGLREPLVEPLAEGALVRDDELAALGIAEEIAETVLGVAPRSPDRDPLLLWPPRAGRRIRLIAQVEDDAPATLIALND